jgi:hypothetical protein
MNIYSDDPMRSLAMAFNALQPGAENTYAEIDQIVEQGIRKGDIECDGPVADALTADRTYELKHNPSEQDRKRMMEKRKPSVNALSQHFWKQATEVQARDIIDNPSLLESIRVFLSIENFSHPVMTSNQAVKDFLRTEIAQGQNTTLAHILTKTVNWTGKQWDDYCVAMIYDGHHEHALILMTLAGKSNYDMLNSRMMLKRTTKNHSKEWKYIEKETEQPKLEVTEAMSINSIVVDKNIKEYIMRMFNTITTDGQPPLPIGGLVVVEQFFERLNYIYYEYAMDIFGSATAMVALFFEFPADYQTREEKWINYCVDCYERELKIILNMEEKSMEQAKAMHVFILKLYHILYRVSVNSMLKTLFAKLRTNFRRIMLNVRDDQGLNYALKRAPRSKDFRITFLERVITQAI